MYFGSKTGYPPDVAELSLAARAVETFLPDPRRPLRKPARPGDDESETDETGATVASGSN